MAATNPPVIQCKDYDYKCYRKTKTSHLYKERGGSLNRVLELAVIGLIGACVKTRKGHVTLRAQQLTD